MTLEPGRAGGGDAGGVGEDDLLCNGRIGAASEQKLDGLIEPVGAHKRRAQHLP